MTGEIIETTAMESRAVATAEIVVPAQEGGTGHGGVATLLTVAAIVAAVIGFRAAVVSSSAANSWQSALRTEVKRSAGAMEDVRTLYVTELPMAVRILQARTVQAELLAAVGTSELVDAWLRRPGVDLQGALLLRSALARLIDPRGMGGFRVLAFGRGLPQGMALPGLARLRRAGSPG
jgi:hypothetical protein